MARFLTIALILCTWLGDGSSAMALARQMLTQPMGCCGLDHHRDSCHHQKRVARLYPDAPTITAKCAGPACSPDCPGGAACTKPASSVNTGLAPQPATVPRALEIQVSMNRTGDTLCISRSSAFRLERPPKA